MSLFGTVAHDAATPSSDVDIAITITLDLQTARLPTLERLGRRENLTALLTRHLGIPVDVVVGPRPHPAIQAAIERDRSVAF